MEKKAILAVSFGTSHPDALAAAIGAVEGDLAAAFPGRTPRRAFTSGMIREKLRARDGAETDSPARALERLAEEGFTDVLVQPTHVICGEEYEKLLAQAAPFRAAIPRLSVGKPLLAGAEDYRTLAAALLADFPAEREDAALVLMGHGTGHFANAAYAQLEYLLHDLGRRDILIGTVEGYPGLEEVLRRLEERPKVGEVLLAPLMVVAGDHAKNDLAGPGPDSWKSVLEARGYRTACRLRGLGEYPGVRALFVRHAEEADRA